MQIFILTFLVGCAAAFVTTIGCRLASRRHRQAGWHIALLGAVVVAALMMYWDNGSLLFHPSQWSHNKRSLGSLLSEFMFLMLFSVIPALIVVRHYRQKFKQETGDVVSRI